MTVATSTFEQAVSGFQSRVEKVGDEQWAAPTPCSEWDVRAVVNHVVGELRWIPPLLEGKTIAEVGDALNGDLLGADPKAAWSAAAREAVAAVSEPNVTERTVHLSYGDRPAGAYISEVAADVVVHSWDLARGIGADDRIDPELIAAARDAFAPQMEAARAAGMFGPALEAAPGADEQTRLLALTGRRRD